MYKFKKLELVILTFFVINSSASFAASCDDYRYSDGMSVEESNGGPKIFATSSVAISFDDISSINSAREEATIEAKSKIGSFLNDGIKNDATIDKVIEESANIKSDSQSTERKANTKELKTTLKKLQSSSQALLRGVVPLADCYTKGKELRVTVGIKPETINHAANLATAMGNSLSTQPTPNASNTQSNSGTSNNENQLKANGTNGNNLRSSEGFSNSSRLDNF
jgi:hypothetical protein